MKITRVIALAVIAASCGLGVAQAQIKSSEPAEFPPSSFQGRQYVDSKGCVFVRAGIDGNVTWIPRVSRSRQQVCGQQPMTAVAKAAAPTAKARPGPAPVEIIIAAPAAKPTAVAKPAPVAVARVQPKPQKQVVRRVAAPTVVQPVQAVAAPRVAPAMAAPAAPVVTAQAAPVRRVAAPAGCVGGSSISARYMASATAFPVRCGPQKEDHVTRVMGTARVAAKPGNVTPAGTVYGYPAGSDTVYVQRTAPVTATSKTVDPYSTYVAPRRVYRSQIDSTRGVQIPDGYKRVWMDGRLNPQRAHQTFAGRAQMELGWTKTVPRYLIEKGTGREVSAQFPGLIYPYTSYAEQNRANSVISTKGSAPAATQAQPRKVSSVSASPAASHSYVQAGVFQSREQAQKAARRLSATGLPTRLGTLHNKGNTYSVVLSGPHSSQASLNAALSRTRNAGFGNAVLRN
ncbi:SPOR domain-containing protein [Rhodobacteraceae bacterium KMM 6894]|nr:SPOR domain-containing protein [Rhodobacteraceae bacterium KMM 6894]